MVYRDFGDLPPASEDALVSFVESGKGLVAVHCASHCFRNSRRYTAIVGGRFARHESGTYRARIIDAQHPAMRGVKSFESWDETYVHNELTDDRRVLMVREQDGGYEPYTWVRKQGTRPRLLHCAGSRPAHLGRMPDFTACWRRRFVGPPAASPTTCRRCCLEASDRLPNYVPDGNHGERHAMQKPLSPRDSMRHMHLPEGFRASCSPPSPTSSSRSRWPSIERGRLWVIESVDYPNDVLDDPPHNGRDRIKICEDTDGDGRADNFTVFADRLNIPTGAGLRSRRSDRGRFRRTSPLLKDTDGDDKADVPRGSVHRLRTRATRTPCHANLHYGFDSWMWASVGYSGRRRAVGRRASPIPHGAVAVQDRRLGPGVSYAHQQQHLGLGDRRVGRRLRLDGQQRSQRLHGRSPIDTSRRCAAGTRSAARASPTTSSFIPIRATCGRWTGTEGITAASGHELYTARGFPAGILESRGVGVRADRPPGAHRLAGAAGQRASWPATDTTCWPAATPGPRRSRRRSDPTARCGCSTGTTTSCSTIPRRADFRPAVATPT